MQRGANRIARGEIGGRLCDGLHAVNRQYEAANGTRRATTIVLQIGKRRVALDGDILRKRAQQIAKWGQRQRVGADGEREIGELRRRVAMFDGVERRSTGLEGGKARRHVAIALVRNIVGRAGESVDRHDGAAIARRDHFGSDGKIFVMTDGHVLDRKRGNKTLRG